MSARLEQISESSRGGWIRRFLGAARYTTRAEGGDPDVGCVDFESTGVLWDALVRSRVGVLSEIRLTDVLVSEWVPVSPGVSATGRAADLGELAPVAIEEAFHGWRTVYDTDSKERFLDAGYGCVRFGPHEMGGGRSDLWLLGATSTKYAHDGFPVAVPREMYRELIGEIRRHGSIRRSLRGTLEWLPDRFVGRGSGHLYHDPFVHYTSMPRAFLRVSDADSVPGSPGRSVVVTVATSFIGRVREEHGFYGAFATFDSGSADSLLEARDWLYNSYIRECYHGHVVTDFDEHFPAADAGASLERVMSGRIDLKSLHEAFLATRDLHPYGGSAWRTRALRRFMLEVSALAGYSVVNLHGDYVGGDQYHVGQAAAVGPGAVATGNVQIQRDVQAGIDLRALAKELEALRRACATKVNGAAGAIAYAGISEAESASSAGNADATETGLLKAGPWALGTADEIGLSLAAEAIRRAMSKD